MGEVEFAGAQRAHFDAVAGEQLDEVFQAAEVVAGETVEAVGHDGVDLAGLDGLAHGHERRAHLPALVRRQVVVAEHGDDLPAERIGQLATHAFLAPHP